MANAGHNLFDPETYAVRRSALRKKLSDGIVLVPGARESPMRYAHNPYPFVQDGTFVYFFGLQEPDLVGVIDLDTGDEWLFGSDPDLDSLIWTGPRRSLADRARAVGVERSSSIADLAAKLTAEAKKGRCIHYLAPYRADCSELIGTLLHLRPAEVAAGASGKLADVVVALREIKGAEEIAEMESALSITAEMHRTAMELTRPGVLEQHVVAAMEEVCRRRDTHPAYPIIFSRRGEILHNVHHPFKLDSGDVVVNDAGALSSKGYSSDVTRTLPVGGRFSSLQADLYDLVLRSQQEAISAVAPGVPFLDVHLLACRVLVDGLSDLGVFRGYSDDVVATGAYAIVLQCGIGHQIGIDVHDMEALGEDRVGYDRTISRSTLFGLERLRLAKPLCENMVVTVEPGLYFIPALIDSWESQKKFGDLINYKRLREFADAGGYRIEDDVLVERDGARVLGPELVKSRADLEAAMSA